MEINHVIKIIKNILDNKYYLAEDNTYILKHDNNIIKIMNYDAGATLTDVLVADKDKIIKDIEQALPGITCETTSEDQNEVTQITYTITIPNTLRKEDSMSPELTLKTFKENELPKLLADFDCEISDSQQNDQYYVYILPKSGRLPKEILEKLNMKANINRWKIIQDGNEITISLSPKNILDKTKLEDMLKRIFPAYVLGNSDYDNYHMKQIDNNIYIFNTKELPTSIDDLGIPPTYCKMTNGPEIERGLSQLKEICERGYKCKVNYNLQKVNATYFNTQQLHGGDRHNYDVYAFLVIITLENSVKDSKLLTKTVNTINKNDAVTNQQLLLNFAHGKLRELIQGLNVTVYEGIRQNKHRIRIVFNTNEIPDEVFHKIQMRAKEFDGEVTQEGNQIIITTDVAPGVIHENTDVNANTSLEVMDAKSLPKIDKEDVDFLIEDEEEAIDGYNEVLTRVKDKAQVKVLKSIIADEKRHIKMIKALLK